MNSQTGVTRKKSEHEERGVSTKSHPRSFLLVIAADRKEISCLQLLYQPHARAGPIHRGRCPAQNRLHFCCLSFVFKIENMNLVGQKTGRTWKTGKTLMELLSHMHLFRGYMNIHIHDDIDVTEGSVLARPGIINLYHPEPDCPHRALLHSLRSRQHSLFFEHICSY